METGAGSPPSRRSADGRAASDWSSTRVSGVPFGGADWLCRKSHHGSCASGRRPDSDPPPAISIGGRKTISRSFSIVIVFVASENYEIDRCLVAVSADR